MLSDHFKIYFEQDNPLSLSEAREQLEYFEWALGKNPNFGFYENGLWLYTRFSNVSSANEWVLKLEFSQLDKVDMFLLDDGELIASSSQGKLRNDNPYRMPILHAELPYATDVELFVRIESQSSGLIAPLEIQSAASFVRSNFFDNLFWGLFYGGLVILAIYNLVLYVGIREPSLLAYVVYISTVILWQFVWGGHMEMVFPGGITPWLGQHTDLIFVIIGLSSGAFTLTFLDTAKTAPKTNPVIKVAMTILAVLGVATMLDLFPRMWQNALVYIVGIIAIGSYIYAGFESYFNKFQPARYFIFAWSILSVGALVGMFSLLGILPANDFTAVIFQVCVFLEAGLFSLALMDKSRNQLEREIQQATNDLRNNMELIEEQNARLDIARKDAIKASNVKSQFLANMSHEIRTPLNAILGFSKELLNVSLTPEKQEQVRIINNSADNLLTIVNDVLDFSKIEAGKLQINNQPFSPNQLLEEMVSVMSKSASLKKLEFVFELGPLPDKLIGDIFRIRQILNNLLSNAVKFTSTGHVTLVAYGEQQEHGIFQLHLKVEDTGIGISRKDRKKLFSAFSQVDDSLNRSYQGTGLGLVISQELVKLMRGQLNMHSVPGQGSCFAVSLPTHQMSNKYYLTPKPEWQDKTVAIFDPYPFTRMATARMLTYLGARVTSIESTDFLSTLDDKFDYLFASLPQGSLQSRNTMLAHFIKFDATQRILTYTGAEPFAQYPSLSQHFNAQVRMPLTPSKLETLLGSSKASQENQLEQRLRKLPAARVLAVDDMDMNLRLLKTWLNPSPLSLTLCHSGQQAVSLCEKHEFDLILMDVQMPNMDGLQASQLIRKTEHNLGTPIIAVTAHAFKEEQERLLASGMDDYLPKPIDINALVELITRWCIQEEHEAVVVPTVDWQLALKRTNHDANTAQEMMSEFIKQLPELCEDIRQQADSRDFENLESHVHRLHGVCCYTGVPKLQSLCNDIESALKRGEHSFALEAVPRLITEAEMVISQGGKLLEDVNLGQAVGK